MKKSKTISKYNAKKMEGSAPICPICGEHRIVVEKEPVEYKLDGEVFTMNEEFFRCYKDGCEYATAEMNEHNKTALRCELMKREERKKKLCFKGFQNETILHEPVLEPLDIYKKQRLDRDDTAISELIDYGNLIAEISRKAVEEAAE